MNASDIKDEVGLEAVISTLPRAAMGFAINRIKLRAAPIWFAAMFEPWASTHKVSSLPLLRLLFLQSVSSASHSNDVEPAHQSAINRALKVIEDLADVSFSTRSVLIGTVEISGPWAVLKRMKSATERIELGDTYDVLFHASLYDADMLVAEPNLIELPLWHNTTNPFQTEWNETRTRWSQPNSPYAFWLRWYDAALEGRSLNPDLERDIALIPDADWEKGAEHIAALIAAIEERHDLKAQVQALRQQLTLAQSATADAAHRGHNQPPELIDSAPEVQRKITIIWGALDEAEAELSIPAPSPSVLRRIGQTLIDVAIAIAKYCSGIANKVIVAAAVSGGTAGGALGMAKLLEIAAPTKTLGQSILDFAAKLTGG